MVGQGGFNWDSQDQGMILGSFFYGYTIIQVPAGILAEHYGGKWIFGLGVLFTSLFTLLTPLAARADVGWLVTVRMLEGLCEGVAFPSMQVLISKWIPVGERGRLGSAILAGKYDVLFSFVVPDVAHRRLSFSQHPVKVPGLRTSRSLFLPQSRKLQSIHRVPGWHCRDLDPERRPQQ